MFTSVGAPEILLVILIVLLLFGADKLPEIAKSVGKGMDEFRKASDSLKNEIEDSTKDINETFESTQSTFKEQLTFDSEQEFNTYGREHLDETESAGQPDQATQVDESSDPDDINRDKQENSN